MKIGIRREDKNIWERRVPLVPADLAELQQQGFQFQVQPSPNRIFTDEMYTKSGLEVAEDLSPCDMVIAVKEIPTELLEVGKSYLYFSHVIKGQDYNMPMLRRLMDLKCSLLDYERIVDGDGRRLIFFSIHAGYAGTIDTLWTLGQRMKARGLDSPLSEILRTYEYSSFEDAKAHLRLIGQKLDASQPLTIGMAGYGNVARGCREVLDCLPCEWVDPTDLDKPATAPIRCVEFRESDMVKPANGQAFELQEYYDHPERYTGDFERFLPQLDVLLNTIYWTERYPRLVTRQWVRDNPDPRLQAIGDISCDYEGSIEITLHSTMPDEPSFVYDAATDTVTAGVDGSSPAVMAVDNLPCEVARESSEHFSSVLRTLVPALSNCDWSASFADLDLPPELKTAVIVHQGELTPDYRYLEKHLETS